MANIAIGPEGWRNATVRNVKLAQTLAQKSNKSSEIGKALDPLPNMRDTVCQLSNDEVRRYTRDVRAVVARLRESLLLTNEEIKSLTRTKEALDTLLEHLRKDLKVNKDSMEIRDYRPPREKGHDGADDLLCAERAHLLNCKKTLEAQQRRVLQQLQVLDCTRRRLFAVVQERSRVLDLLCHSLASVEFYCAKSAEERRNREGQTCSPENDLFGPGNADGLAPYTPECDLALSDAADARARCAFLRRESSQLIDATENLQRAAHLSVNDGLTKKMAETVALKQNLGLVLGENRHSTYKAQRWYDATDRARGYTLGPIMSSDIAVPERLDRPLIRVFQRHVGSQVPEAQHMIRAGDGLLQSLTATSRNIGLLRLAQQKLDCDLKSKSAGLEFDGDALRLRRRRADHRWTLGNAF
ncbi:coiled-coil domain-containing protein 105-like [Gigantopelta aegis]|uniref:coiled-coil domain-containing protein 105-like n=1 Tax=Gigantopelta aegis TaxID=1735272 RepID=UPI001B88B75E|nr:coiled-coil domain-containing protein 105-like [Gigantopelta aegis]